MCLKNLAVDNGFVSEVTPEEPTNSLQEIGYRLLMEPFTLWTDCVVATALSMTEYILGDDRQDRSSQTEISSRLLRLSNARNDFARKSGYSDQNRAVDSKEKEN
ncbi:predicted protein [Aspergillus nidulans FGSC A4]|uniref:Uncharacterized protein n=1 Tax=Emericella nidulans (strain FGSC A4 / ATCC 38163 / CBS 112.46 / NRRL 194 / M139) TaxID=227321 RepID=Q5BBT6_EMENI|nr:hypothetical protein [Aspergillus nidulans FGSC A4]EAA63895.1 predicted protein [Aspergillus nidulans FGSC A4]CBF85971.1 TPA: hypothetical protein ANIA_01994 [Aspergillus nidulans FGSC A4]|eukprot:XP_659598.1 predicted protein [Aspergillus nidulans FGSC A4]